MKLIFYLQVRTRIDSITLGVHGQAWPKHPKQQLYNIFPISQGKVKDGVDYSLLTIVKHFFNLIVSFFICVTRHAQNTQNKKFDISLQYLKREVNDKVDFLHAGKYENLLEIDIMILWRWSSIPKVPKIASLPCLYNISKNKIEMKLIFCIQIGITVAYKLISTLWAPQLATR